MLKVRLKARVIERRASPLARRPLKRPKHRSEYTIHRHMLGTRCRVPVDAVVLISHLSRTQTWRAGRRARRRPAASPPRLSARRRSRLARPSCSSPLPARPDPQDGADARARRARAAAARARGGGRGDRPDVTVVAAAARGAGAARARALLAPGGRAHAAHGARVRRAHVEARVRVRRSRSHSPRARRPPAVSVGAPLRDRPRRTHRAHQTQEGDLRGAPGTFRDCYVL